MRGGKWNNKKGGMVWKKRCPFLRATTRLSHRKSGTQTGEIMESY
jgi:hypothetical protein